MKPLPPPQYNEDECICVCVSQSTKNDSIKKNSQRVKEYLLKLVNSVLPLTMLTFGEKSVQNTKTITLLMSHHAL